MKCDQCRRDMAVDEQVFGVYDLKICEECHDRHLSAREAEFEMQKDDAVLSFSGDHITHVANIVKTDETSATDHMDEPSEFRAYAATKGGGK